MLAPHITKFKIYFSILSLLILVALGGGSMYVSSSWGDINYAANAYHTLKYRLAYTFENGRELRASMRNLFMRDEVFVRGAEAAQDVPVLVYHGVLNESDDSSFNLDIKRFRDQMFALKRAGYETVTSEELYRFLRGEQELPPRSVMITFDDGRTDSVEKADPLLRALGFKATMFVIANVSVPHSHENNYYLSRNDLAWMERTGRWDIQSHTFDGHGTFSSDAAGTEGHFFSHARWIPAEGRMETEQEFEERVRSDMTAVRDGIAELTERVPIGFAFPFGDFGQNNTNMTNAKEIVLGNASDLYRLAFYQNMPGIRFSSNYTRDENRDQEFFLVRRVGVDPSWGGKDLLAALGRSGAKALPFSDSFENGDQGWVPAWGAVAIEGDDLLLEPPALDTGAATILDGTMRWRDYRVRATVNIPDKGGVYVWVRFRNDFYNAACNFGEGFAHIEQTLDGVGRVIQGSRDPRLAIPKEDFEVEARVRGRTLECAINGAVVATSQFLSPLITQGGIGFKTWDNEHGRSGLIIKSVLVEPL